MRSPIGWLSPFVAAIAAGVAIWAGPNYSIAVPAGFVAVAAGGLTVTGALRVAHRAPASAPPPAATELPGLRDWFRGGPLGREGIVLTLDRLERDRLRPDLPARSAASLEEIQRLPIGRFREYIRGRLDDLEREV